MGKILAFLGVVALLIAAAAWYFVSFHLDGVLQQRIEQAGSLSLGTAVEVQGVETDLRAGTLKIREISVANPEGFDGPYAVRFRGVEAAVDYPAREIKRVIIDNPDIVMQERDGQTNFGQMLQSLDSAPAEPTGDSAEEPIITIRHFRINEARAAFESKTYDRYTDLEVDAVELNDLVGTPSELATVIAREVVGELSSEAAVQLLKAQARKQLGDVEEKVSKTLRDVFGGGDDDDSDQTDGSEQ